MATRNSTQDQPNQEDAALSQFDATLTQFTPALSENDFQTIERAFTDPGFTAIRRFGLTLAQKDGGFFQELSEDPSMALTVSGVLGNLADHVRWLRDLADVIELGRQRAVMALTAHDNAMSLLGIEPEDLFGSVLSEVLAEPEPGTVLH